MSVADERESMQDKWHHSLSDRGQCHRGDGRLGDTSARSLHSSRRGHRRSNGRLLLVLGQYGVQLRLCGEEVCDSRSRSSDLNGIACIGDRGIGGGVQSIGIGRISHRGRDGRVGEGRRSHGGNVAMGSLPMMPLLGRRPGGACRGSQRRGRLGCDCDGGSRL